MEKEIIVALISLCGVIISITLTCIINNKINLLKVHSEFSGQLYSKRLEAYLEIYELISGFVKSIVRRKISHEKITYEELKEFYDKYSILDSKSGLLFSHSLHPSFELLKEITKILIPKKENFTISDDSVKSIQKKLAVVEINMKFELGVFKYKDPLTIINKFKLTETYKEVLAEMAKHR